MKKIIAMLAAGALCTAVLVQTHKEFSETNVLNVSAAEEGDTSTYGDLEYTVWYDGTLSITGCNKEAEDVEIPLEIDGIAVTMIGAYAFEDCSKLVSVTIPDSVNCISGMAFYDCTKLTNINIPESVTYIGGRAFASTEWLSNQRAENEFVVVNGILIDGISSGSDVIIPDNIISIGDYAFSYSSMTSISIPESVKSIGDHAFGHCTGLTEITIPDSVTSVGSAVFEFCSNLTSVHISDTLRIRQCIPIS